MSTTTIRKRFKKNGTLADPYSVKFADSAGTYGVKDGDGTSIVSSATALTKDATGIYSSSWTDSAVNQVYTYCLEVVLTAGDSANYIQGTINGGVGSASFDSAGMTVTEMRDYVAQKRYDAADYASATATQQTDIDMALTQAGRAASLWEGRGFWWSRDTGEFDTVDGTHQYALKTVNSADMADIYAPYAVYWSDEYHLTKMSKEEYDEWATLYATTGTGDATKYCIWGDAQMGLKPIPDSATTVYVKYFKVQGKIGSASATVIVPPEYHFPILCKGALFILRNETVSGASLHDCPEYMEAITEMKSSDPGRWFDIDTTGTYPTGRRVHQQDGGVYITDGSLSP